MTIKENILQLIKIRDDLNIEILKLAGYRIAAQDWSVIGTWDCPKSPHDAGLCCYDHYKDPVHDCCVFCGQPEERK